MITQVDKNKYQSMNESQLNLEFLLACDAYNTELIKYLISDQELPCCIACDYEEDLILFLSCHNKDTDMINFLFSCPHLINTPDLEGMFKFFYHDKRMDIINFIIENTLIKQNSSEDFQKYITLSPELSVLFNKQHLEDTLSVKEKSDIIYSKNIKNKL